MADIKWNPKGLNSFMTRTVQPYLRKKAEEVAAEARNRAPHGATGDLRESIVVENNARGGVTVRVTAGYAGFVHQGTGPQGTPPQAPYYPRLRRRGLILWSDSKNLNPKTVASGIAQKGTAPNPFLKESIEYVLKRFDLRWISQEIE